MTERRVLSDADRRKVDDSPDGSFYEAPRFVTHADDGFCERLTELYAEAIPADGRVFDVLSSWVSHLPDADYERVVGHGLNASELDANDRLGEWFLQDLNDEQALPLETDAFDAVLCALSVQSLQYPAAVFSEFARVLDADGVLVVSFTNRMFPTKAVRAWRTASMAGRESLVRSSVDATDAFEAVRVVRDRPESDPFRAVVARH